MSDRTPLGAGYWKLWTGSVVSNFGDGLATVAYPWLASAVTRDPFQIALIGVATRLPWLVFTLPAGVITDRVDRRRLVAWMDAFRFLVTSCVGVVVLTAGGDLSSPAEIAAGEAAAPARAGFLLATIYVAALLFGFAEVLRDNAAQTLMPALVEKPQLERANGRLWGAEMVMNSFVGPPIGGILIAAAFALPFFVDAGTFAVSALLLASIPGRFAATGNGPGEARPRFRDQLVEGVRWLWSHRLLRSLAVILGAMNAMTSLALAVYVLFVQEILGLEAAGFGVLLTAGAAGGVLGSLAASRVSARIGPGASLFVALLGGAATYVVTGLTSSGAVVWVMFALWSFLAVLWNVITVSLRQTIIPDRLLGRVNSVYRFFAWGMMPLGSVLGGAIVTLFEAVTGRDLALRMPFLVAGVVFVLLYLYALPRLNTSRIEEARAGAEAITS